jgi:PAS domain S-box-containing protein
MANYRRGSQPDPAAGGPSADDAVRDAGASFDVDALLRAFMDSTPDWLFAKDLQHRFLFVNRSFAAAINRTPDEMIGRRDTDFWSMDQCEPDPATGRRGFHDDDRRAFAGETVHNPAEMASVADGTIRVFDTVKSPLRAAEGKVLGVLCYCRDITERHRADLARHESEAQLRQAQKLQAIGTLAGGIAHDFNNILTAILGHAELLERDSVGSRGNGRGAPDAEAVRASAAGILSAGRRARDLVQQILTFSRRRERPRTPTRLQPIVEEALQLLRPTLPTNIEIRTAFACVDHRVLADATQLHQVVVNLCTNAAHAMRARGGVLELQCAPAELDAAFCSAHPGTRPGLHQMLLVRDTGHGMEPAVLERIFEPFFTTKESSEGAGLGLAVVHGILQSHQGAIQVDSRPGEGTSIRVYLPIDRVAVAAEVVAPPTPPHGHGEHVLFVDDEAMLTTLVARTITDLGYRVTAHQRPAAALAEFTRDPARFDLVLCDLKMPGMTGLEFAQHVRRVRPDLPVLLTSGLAGDLDQETLQRSGIREMLEKPFLMQQLADALARHVCRRG